MIRSDWWTLWVIIYLIWGAGFSCRSRQELREKGDGYGWLPVYYYAVLALIWPVFVPLQLKLALDRLWHKALFGTARFAARIVRYADKVAVRHLPSTVRREYGGELAYGKEENNER